MALRPPGTKSTAKTVKSRRKSRKGGKARKGGRRRARRMGMSAGSLSGRFAAAADRTKQLTDLAVFGGEVGGATWVSSLASGYLGDKINLGEKVDGRLVASAAALGWGAWDPKKPNHHAVNIGLGILGSWLAERGMAYGARMAQDTEKPAETATTAEQPAGGGMVIGNLYDGVGGKEERLGRKLARLQHKAEKKGVEWKEVREAAQEKAEKKGWDTPGPGAAPAPQQRVVVAPGYGYGGYGAPAALPPRVAPRPFRPLAWARRHPRMAARLAR